MRLPGLLREGSDPVHSMQALQARQHVRAAVPAEKLPQPGRHVLAVPRVLRDLRRSRTRLLPDLRARPSPRDRPRRLHTAVPGRVLRKLRAEHMHTVSAELRILRRQTRPLHELRPPPRHVREQVLRRLPAVLVRDRGLQV